MKLKYTAYFDERHMSDTDNLVTVCESVSDKNEAKARIGDHMRKCNLNSDCLYMYILMEEDWSSLDVYGLPETEQIHWSDYELWGQ